MTFRLRYLDRMLDLSEAPFTVGRNPSCQLTIDNDVLISRRHATFRVHGDHVIVEDHDSRNGVIVNGQRIVKEAVLEPGDTVLIGVQQLVLDSDKKRKGKGKKRPSKSATSLAATGLHQAVASNDDELAATVDFVTIGGASYAVVPKTEYLQMRKKLAAATRAASAPARAAARAPAAKKQKKK